jgi:hypothetical protein
MVMGAAGSESGTRTLPEGWWVVAIRTVVVDALRAHGEASSLEVGLKENVQNLSSGSGRQAIQIAATLTLHADETPRHDGGFSGPPTDVIS